MSGFSFNHLDDTQFEEFCYDLLVHCSPDEQPTAAWNNVPPQSRRSGSGTGRCAGGGRRGPT